MAQFIKHFVQDLTQDIKIRQCGTIVFNADNLSNVISVDLYNGTEPYSGGGTVAGAVICPDGATVALDNGTLTGNVASVTLTADCFAIPGQIGVGVQVISGSTRTTVLKAIYNVELLSTDNMVDPDSRITASVTQLVADIEAATAEIPSSDMASLMSGIAPTFSDSTAYPAGAYVYHNGTLHKFTADHAAGSWTGTDATAVALGNDLGSQISDLKSAVENVYGGTTYNLYRCINTTQTLNGVTITTDIANNVTVSGTASANGGRTLLRFGSTTFPAGTYYFSVTALGSPTVSPMLTDSTTATVIYSGTSFTLAESTDLYLVFNVVKNTTYNQSFMVQVAVTQGAEIIPPITAVDRLARMDIDSIESEISSRSIIVDANGGGDYTSLSAAVQYAYAQGDYTIHVKAGTYNILNELDFTDKTSLPGYGEGNNNAWGLKIGNNMRIICENNVVFSGLYDGTDFDIKTRFSMFNVTGNYELENMEIVIQNLRYCIHEDTPTLSLNQAYTSRIKNCRMHHMGGYTTSACLGCGDANNSLTIIEGGEYQADDYDYPISMHNHTGTANGRIIIDGVYIAGDGTVRLSGFSATSAGDVLQAVVRNSRLGAQIFIDDEETKVNLIEFGNTVSS